jgi:FdrA protein
MKQIIVEKATYLDSISLMGISRKVSEARGVRSAMVAMATDTNLLLLKEAGFDPSAAGIASANDLLIAVDAADAAALEAAVALARQEIQGGRVPGGASCALSGDRDRAPSQPGLGAALGHHPEINLVMISVPGRYAAREAERALAAGRHVMIFSDNVSVEDEKRLKAKALERSLLLMGPDCGTAIINGVGLGFANQVPRGPVGIVAASGTGAQEVSSILARWNVGISHIIGTGGRDVSAAIGGAMTKMGLRALADDEATRVIVVISKLPAPDVTKEILDVASRAGKPCVISFAGWSAEARRANLVFARDLTQAAIEAATAAGGTHHSLDCVAKEGVGKLQAAAAAIRPPQRYLRGLFSGGTLAQEAVFILGQQVRPVATNMKLPGTAMLEDPSASRGHTVVDLGDDAFTRGRAHPMIDQSYRLARLRREMADPETAVVLLDVVLGYGCNGDPAGEIASVLAEGAGSSGSGGRAERPAVVASVCGTRSDPQDYDRQRRELEAAGVLVAETNAVASGWVAELLRGK